MITFFYKILLCIVFIHVLGYVRPSVGLSRPSTMLLDNNEYKNVVIAIHDSVPEDKSLINALKDTMTKASKYLYTATRQRAFFKEIKILLPSSWSNDASYTVPKTENLAFADVIITDPIRGKRSLPLARSYEGCGKQGVHVLLTKEFLTKPRVEPYFGDPAKYFIHAFAQFRWGVFQEYAEEGEHEFYISPTTGRPEPIKCTIMLRGLVQKNDSAHTICYLPSQAQSAHVVAAVDNKTGLYENDCQWRPYPTRQRTKASLMDHQYIVNLETFCDDNHTNYMTEHNYEAPSKHNRLCGHRSTWDIITRTDDFGNGRNPPRGLLDAQLEPTFILMRATSRKRRAAILVDPALTKKAAIQQALGHLKHEAHTHDIELLVLRFENENISHHALHSVESIRSFFRHPSHGGDSHKLKHHIEKTKQTLKEEGKLNDTHLIIMTHQKLHHVKKILADSKQNGLKLSAISIDTSNGVSNQEALGLHSAGKAAGHTLLDRLRKVILEETPNTVIITTDELNLKGQKPVSSNVDIDQTLVNRITFVFHYENDQPFIDLRSPSGVIYGEEDDTCTVDNDVRVIIFHFEFTEVGTWTYKVRQSSESFQNVSLTVISEENNMKSDPVVLRQSVKRADDRNVLLLNLDVTQGSHPLLDLRVNAKIESPTEEESYVQLLDNGAGADISKNDGIYSRMYLAPRLNGSYHVTFIVSGKSGEVQRKEETFHVLNDENAHVKKEVTIHLVDGNIQRQISGGTVYLDRAWSNITYNDAIPPSCVTDLVAVKYISYRNTIVLKWTAPGDDLDHGKPSGYQVFIGYDVRNVRMFLNFISTGRYYGNGHVARETIAAKSSATENEIVLWNVKVVAKTYVFAVRAFDVNGNLGDISNVATTGIF